MSASGHDRTFALHQPMSALPPIATSIVSALLRGSQLIIVFDPVGERGAQGLWAAHPLPSERNGAACPATPRPESLLGLGHRDPRYLHS
jgi:hypothetical protein